MASAEMNRLMDHARIRLPGALDAAIYAEMFAVLNEFFQRSNIWYEDIGFAVYPTTDTYLENPAAFTYTLSPTQGAVTRLIWVVDANELLVPAVMPEPGVVVLKYSPNSGQTYTARVALTVVDPVTSEGHPEFPEWVLRKYGNGILDGLLGRMMTQIAKPYTSAQAAQFHLRNFKQTVSHAKVEAGRQNVYRNQNWRFPQSFASRAL